MLARLNSIISPLVQQGQSIHQIYVSHENELMCSEKTIYNYIDACLLDVRNIDLPRKVKFRERYKKPVFKVDKGCRIGRNYEAFESFIENNPDTAIVQMDSVIGTKGGKCLLTIHFVEASLMLAFLRDANTSQSVIDVFNELDKTLGREQFRKLFPVILTDNGSEFSNPKAIEYGSEQYNNLRTRIYYCDAGCPHQKGAVERLDVGMNTADYYEHNQRAKTQEFKEKYRKRASHGWKNGEMKRFHGLDRARGYGLKSMSMQAKLTALAVNLKRIAL